jgi:hypothetical protein
MAAVNIRHLANSAIDMLEGLPDLYALHGTGIRRREQLRWQRDHEEETAAKRDRREQTTR